MVLLITFLVVGALIYLFTRRSPEPRLDAGDYTVEDRYNVDRKLRQEEVDRLLEKVARRGMQGLTSRERALLKEHAESL
ncbi:MAG: hypothetical protein EOO08_14840 [Chitinophagaceae bacterium]|nr:MAG: hypothetical protein EOO08_14840 [Chitinophagaceae bacterium]